MTSSSKLFGAAFLFGGFALLLVGMQLWFGHAAEAVSAALSHRMLEAALMLLGATVATGGLRTLSLARQTSE